MLALERDVCFSATRARGSLSARHWYAEVNSHHTLPRMRSERVTHCLVLEPVTQQKVYAYQRCRLTFDAMLVCTYSN